MRRRNGIRRRLPNTSLSFSRRICRRSLPQIDLRGDDYPVCSVRIRVPQDCAGGLLFQAARLKTVCGCQWRRSVCIGESVVLSRLSFACVQADIARKSRPECSSIRPDLRARLSQCTQLSRCGVTLSLHTCHDCRHPRPLTVPVSSPGARTRFCHNPHQSAGRHQEASTGRTPQRRHDTVDRQDGISTRARHRATASVGAAHPPSSARPAVRALIAPSPCRSK